MGSSINPTDTFHIPLFNDFNQRNIHNKIKWNYVKMCLMENWEFVCFQLLLFSFAAQPWMLMYRITTAARLKRVFASAKLMHRADATHN